MKSGIFSEVAICLGRVVTKNCRFRWKEERLTLELWVKRSGGGAGRTRAGAAGCPGPSAGPATAKAPAPWEGSQVRHTFIHASIHSCIPPFAYSCIDAFIHWCT